MNGLVTMEFRKMNGLGNDFVVLDARSRPVEISEDKARAIADRKTGIGCDQLIVLEPSATADVRMRIWNNAGFEVESCGNASRCVAMLLGGESRIETKGGILTASAFSQQYDALIRNGKIVDGSGNPWFLGDVGVIGDRIAFIGHAAAEVKAKRTIDATGLIVAPGFIDMLGQSETNLLIDKRAVSKLTQGITTEITGEGESVAPFAKSDLVEQKDFLEHFHLTIDWESLDQYFNRLAKQGRFTLKEFSYDAEQDVYHCPAGAELRPMEGYKEDAGGKLHVRYAALQSVCSKCPLRSRCLTDKARRREVHRWQHQEVIDRHRARMAQPEAKIIMRRRAALAEHPFGTLKCRAGYRHFLLRGFDKVRGEWTLMALCYNFSRVLSILGPDGFLAYLAERRPRCAKLLFKLVSDLASRLCLTVQPSWARVCRNSAATRLAVWC